MIEGATLEDLTEWESNKLDRALSVFIESGALNVNDVVVVALLQDKLYRAKRIVLEMSV